MMKRKHISTYFSFMLLIIAVGLYGCAPPGSDNASGESAPSMVSVNIRLHNRSAKLASGSSITATIPSITEALFWVSASDMEDIFEVFPIPAGQTSLEISVLVPEGPDREFVLELRDARGKVIITGDAIADLAGETTTVDINIYQVDGGATSPVILLPVANPDPTRGYYFNAASQTFSGTCDTTLTEIWMDYSLFDTDRTYLPALDSTFAISYVAGSPTWSYTYVLTSGYNLIEFYGIDSNNTYSFPPAKIQAAYDSTPPYTAGHNPADGAIDVPANTNIVVHVKDDFITRLSTIVMTVEGSTVTPVIGGSIQDYTLIFTPPAAYVDGDVIDVTIDAEDFAGNVMVTDSYSFTIGPDLLGPTFVNLFPADGAVGVPLNTGVSFEVDDNISGVDYDSMNVFFDTTTPVVLMGVTQGGYSVTNIPDGAGGFDVTITPAALFNYGQTVEVLVVAFDSTANPGGANYSFTCLADTNDPTISAAAYNPVPNSIDAPLTTPVYFEIDDDVSGVDQATLDVTVEGADAILGGVPQGEFSTSSTITPNGAGFDVTVVRNSPFVYGQVVDVTIDAADNNNNSMSQASYNFTCIDDVNNPPIVSMENPALDATGVPKTTNIFFRIDDDVSGVDLTALNVTIEGANAIVNGIPQTDYSASFTAVGLTGYDVDINPLNDFSLAQVVDVTIDATDNNSNAMGQVAYSFFISGTQYLKIDIPYFDNTSVNTPTMTFSGINSGDTEKIEVIYVSTSFNTTFDMLGFFPGDTTWGKTYNLELGPNDFTFTGYDSTFNPGAFDTTSIFRTNVAASAVHIIEPNNGNDYSTPIPNVNFYGSSDFTDKIWVSYISASNPVFDTTSFLPGFVSFDTSWTYAANLTDGANDFTFTSYDTLGDVGLAASISIFFDTTYIAAPVITSPNSGMDFPTTTSPQTLAGSCDSTLTESMFIDYHYAADTTQDTLISVSYSPGTPTWSQIVSLNDGLNEFAVYGEALDSTKSGKDYILIFYDTTVATPTIIAPNNGADFSTYKRDWTINGLTDGDTQTIYVNTFPLGTYSTHDTTWTFDTTLHEGINSFSIQAQDDLGNTSLPAFLNIEFLPQPLKAEGYDTTVELHWKNLTDPSWNQVLIMRRSGAAYPSTFPTNSVAYNPDDTIGDGMVIYTGSDTTFIDSGLTNYMYYYYMMFPYDTANVYEPPLKAVAATRPEMTIISNATNDQKEPRIWGDVVVWTDFRGGTFPEIFMYNLSTKLEKNVSNLSSDSQSRPRIWGSRIAYIDDSVSPMGIGYHEMTFDSAITLDPVVVLTPLTLDIYDHDIVYSADFSDAVELMKYDLSLPALSPEGVVTGANYFNPAIWDTTVVYERDSVFPDIYTHGISSLASEQSVVFASTNDSVRPDLWRDTLVWQDDRYANYDIFYREMDTAATEMQITNDSLPQINPSIFGNIIVWEDYRYDTTNAEIYLYDLSELTAHQLTFDSTKAKLKPDVWGDKVVWAQDDGGAGPDFNIYMIDHEPTGEIALPNPPKELSGFDVWGDKVVYSDNRNGNFDIFLYDMTTRNEVAITFDSSDQVNPAIYENTIVWQDFREGTADIYLHEPFGTDVRLNFDTTGPQEFPDIFDRYVVWQDKRGSDYDVYCLNLFTNVETNLTSGISGDQLYPRIHYSKVVWEDHRAAISDIYGYDLKTSTISGIILDGAFDQLHPDVYDGQYVYEQVNAVNDIQIYYDGATNTNLTSSPGIEHYRPRIFGNRIVWYKNNGMDDDVYMYDRYESSLYLLTGQKFNETGPVINQDKVLYIRQDTTFEGKLFLFDLY